MSINEAFIPNMTGKTVAFDVQPYRSGRGTIKTMTPRLVKHTEFVAGRGRQRVEYEVYDLEIAVETGCEVGALVCGVPVRDTMRSLGGQTTTLIGITYGEIYEAVEKNRTIVKAICG